QLAGVIEYGCPGRNRRPPAAPADPGSDVIARPAHGRIRVHAQAALTVFGLQLPDVADVVERGRRAQREVRRPRPAGLRGDEDDALTGPRAVDRARSCALQDLERLDVVRVQVCGPVRDHRALTRVAAIDRIEAR